MQPRQPGLHHGLLRGEQRALCIKQIKLAGNAALISQVRKPVADAFCISLCLLRPQLLAQRGPAGERVGHFPKRGLNGFFIQRHGDVALHSGRLQPGPVAACVENWQKQPGCQRPPKAAAFKQVTQVRTGTASAGSQRNAGEKRRPRRADIGVGRQQQLLGLTHIGAACQQVRRQVCWYINHHRHIRQALAGRQGHGQLAGQRLAEQLHQHVLI